MISALLNVRRMNAAPTRLHGDVLRKTSVAGVTITERVYASDLRLPEHSHREPDFCFVLTGSFTEISGKQVRNCRPHSVLFHPPGEAHSDHFHTGTRCLGLQFDRSGTDALARWQTKLGNAPVNSRGGRLPRLAAQLYREFCLPDAASRVMIEGLVLQMMAETFRQGAAAPLVPRWLAQAKQIVHEQFNDFPSLAQLARSAGVHPVHLAREFRRFYGCTMTEYVRQRRIDFACHEMLNSRASLSEIALAAGFFDQSHFARTFKAQMSMSPKQYRTTLGRS
jgi:AraC family transcriptional regulator